MVGRQTREGDGGRQIREGEREAEKGGREGGMDSVQGTMIRHY